MLYPSRNIGLIILYDDADSIIKNQLEYSAVFIYNFQTNQHAYLNRHKNIILPRKGAHSIRRGASVRFSRNWII